ncbi:MAG: nuclear transport factor 2 family protein [Actinomycetota bacterium]|nr:nuclear transport factor 2 family protein [Actinomycetota bacterium]
MAEHQGDGPATGVQIGDVEQRLRAIEDRAAIVEVLHRYYHLVDRIATDRLAEVFTEDCVVDRGPGMGGERRGLDHLAHSLAAGLRRFAATSHQLSSPVVTLDGDQATAASSVLAWHHVPGPTPDARLFGEYHDVLARRHGGWRITVRHLQVAGHRDFDVAWDLIDRPGRAAPPAGRSETHLPPAGT